jgi:GNAT superfamily N-acetyltransferase
MSSPRQHTGVVVRPARPDDATAIALLSGQLGYPSTPEQVTARLRRVLPEEGHAVFVAEAEDGRVCGFAHVFGYHVVESDPRAEVSGLVVDAALHGRGIGKRLMQRVEDWARQRGYPVVSLRSNVVREQAHTFYEGLGYRCHKTQKAFRKDL